MGRMDILKKPWLVAILSSLGTIFVLHFIHSVEYQRMEVSKYEVRRSDTTGKPGIEYVGDKQRNSKLEDSSGRDCAPLESPPNLMKRTPAILETGRVKQIDYKKFLIDDKIECVTHHAAVSDTKICIMPTSKDSLISGSLRNTAGWEPQITSAFKRALVDCPDCQVLDFGSNLGVYALIGASANRRVYAVEPMHENLEYLVKSVRSNGWEKRITIITNTLSDVYEEVEFWRPWSNAGGSIARKIGAPAPDRKLYDGPYDKVSSVQIDNLLEVIDFNKAIMKIDIEGYEPRAMSGASRFFAQMDIPMIFMEWSNKGTDPMALTMVMNLVKLGYEVHNPNMEKLAQPSAQAVKTWPFDIIWKKK